MHTYPACSHLCLSLSLKSQSVRCEHSIGLFYCWMTNFLFSPSDETSIEIEKEEKKADMNCDTLLRVTAAAAASAHARHQRDVLDGLVSCFVEGVSYAYFRQGLKLIEAIFFSLPTRARK